MALRRSLCPATGALLCPATSAVRYASNTRPRQLVSLANSWILCPRSCQPAYSLRMQFSSSSELTYASQSAKDGTDSIRDALSGLGGSSSSSNAAKEANGAISATRTSGTGRKNMMEGLADLIPLSGDENSMSSTSRANTASSRTTLGGAAGSAINSPLGGALDGLSGLDDLDRMKREVDHSMDEYHFSVYSHKHNTHVTVAKPNRDVILSMSCGNLGFRKAQRGSYDAAYQLGAYVCDRLYQRGWHKNIQKMEVTLRGFGSGREALSKILLGTEGRLLRSKITRVADSTRLKFGGTRSKKPRRLG